MENGDVTSAHSDGSSCGEERVNTFLTCSGHMGLLVTGLLAAHVAFLLHGVSWTVTLLKAVLHTHGLRADLQRRRRRGEINSHWLVQIYTDIPPSLHILGSQVEVKTVAPFENVEYTAEDRYDENILSAICPIYLFYIPKRTDLTLCLVLLLSHNPLKHFSKQSTSMDQTFRV